MLAQFLLVVIIVILILLLCLRKNKSRNDRNGEGGQGGETSSVDRAEASLRELENRQRSTTTPTLGNTIPAQSTAVQSARTKRRREAAIGVSLNSRKLEEGDSVRAIQAILAAARDLPTAAAAEGSSSIEETKEDGGDAPRTTKTTTTPQNVEEGFGGEEFEEGEGGEGKSSSSIVNSWRKVTDSVINTIVGPPECTICLDPYEPGQTISWPKYTSCDHIFHKDCLEEWLLKHDDCPLCRTGLVHGGGMAEP